VTEQERIPFPTKTLPIGSKEDLGRFFFTKAKGNSMEPDIHDWDLVLVRHQADPTESDKVLLVHNGTPKIKYIKSKWDWGYELVSLNKNIDTLEVVPKDELSVVGVVKLVVSSH
jgi:phage repressor protein C with HTH and peptisase S24 domain